MPAKPSIMEHYLQLRDTLRDIREMAADRADAACVGDPPRFVPNAWMQVQTLIDEVLPHD